MSNQHCIIQIYAEAKQGKRVKFNIAAENYTVDWGDNTPPEQSFNSHEYKINQTTTITITGTNFTTFQLLVSEFPISELKIESLTLETLVCCSLDLTKLDITKCPNIITLFCHNNKLVDLSLTFQKQLSYLDCKCNKLKNLDLSNCTGISVATCNGNHLQSVNIENCKDIVYLNLFYNRLSLKRLNSIIESLPTAETKANQINIGLNPGTQGCDLAVLKQKNWLLDITLTVPQP